MSFFSTFSNGAFTALVSLLMFQQTASKRAADLIQPDDLKAELFFLAADDLKGRDAGSAEDHIATDYIASEFVRLGLKPVGDGGTYFQNMEIVTGSVEREHLGLSAKISGVDHTFKVNQDFRWSRQSLHAGAACGPVVFAGYGISAPEFGYNDFSN